MTPNAVRKTTRLWLTLSYLFSSACLWAQTGGNAASELPKVIPPSPEAAALGKYGALPVGLYTGVPSISVPLYEIKGRRLTLPVSLNYHASGVRVDEVASWVGLGWTLNAGGVITRSVKGMPDEQDYLTGNYLIPDLTNTNQLVDFDYLCDVADNRKDTEPDDFFFNFAGLNGRFVFDQYGRIFHSSESNLRIEQVSNQQFEITAEDGTVYVFGKNRAGTETACETSTYPAQLGGTSCISSWYLTEILASDGTDRISFKYLSDNSQSVFHSGQTHHYPVGPTPYSQCNSEEWDYGTLHTIVIADSRRLREIAFTGGKLTFTSLKDRQDLGWGGYRLDEMKIENDLRYLRNFKFSYSYFNNGTSDAKRLQLKSVEEYDNSVRKPPHRFTYNESITYNGLSLPKIRSKAQDHWGFYNGAFDNERLLHGIPAGQYNGVLLAGANREPGADFLAGVGMLEKIQYPSGGSTRFEFEAHDTGGGKGYRKVPQTQFVTTNIGGSALESSQTFTLSEGVLASVVFERPSPDFLQP